MNIAWSKRSQIDFFLGPHSSQILVFEYSSSKQIAITQKRFFLLTSNLDHVLNVSSATIGQKIKGVSLAQQRVAIKKLPRMTYKNEISESGGENREGKGAVLSKSYRFTYELSIYFYLREVFLKNCKYTIEKQSSFV